MGTSGGKKRVLFVVFAQPGHLNPMIPVAQRLHRAGHEVTFFSYDPLGDRLERAGLPVRSFSVAPEADPRTTAAPRPLRTRALAARMRDPRWLKRWTQLNLVDSVPAQTEALERVFDEVRPDVVCTDPLNYAGAIVAGRREVPWAALSTNLVPLAPSEYRSPFFDVHSSLVEDLIAILGDDGRRLHIARGEAISPYLNIVFTTTAFVPRALSGNDFSHLVGPSIPLGRRGDETPFPWEALRDDVPLVFVAFGGGEQLSFERELFETLVASIEPDEAQLVLALGELRNEALVQSLPRHVLAVGYAPQRELLARATAFVTHGGANSIMESLTMGKPMLVLPLAHEQPLQGLLVERSGTGYTSSPEQLSVEACREMLSALIAPGNAFRLRAEEIAASYARSDGAQVTAHLVLQLAEERVAIAPA